MASPIPDDYDQSFCWPPKVAIVARSTIFHGSVPLHANLYGIAPADTEDLAPYLPEDYKRHAALMGTVPLKWRYREYACCNNHPGAPRRYTPPVWESEHWWECSDEAENHYVHAASTPGLIAYTESEMKGCLDRQTVLKPGRYLQRYFPELGEDKIRYFAEWQSTGQRPDIVSSAYSNREKFPLLFAHTAEEIEYTYVEGPDSCMNGEARRYCNGEVDFHPSAVYASGDLAIAYLKDPSRPNNDQKEVIARALVYPANKVYSRIYPTPGVYDNDGWDDEQEAEAVRGALRERLEAAGYTYSSSGFDGAKLQKLPFSNNRLWVMPYVDGLKARLDGETLVLSSATRDGNFSVSATCGYINNPSFPACPLCGGVSDQAHTIVRELNSRGQPLHLIKCCYRCHDRAFFCEGIQAKVFWAQYNAIRTANGKIYSSVWFQHNGGYRCDLSGEYFLAKEDPFILVRGAAWCLSRAQVSAFQAPDGEWFRSKRDHAEATRLREAGATSTLISSSTVTAISDSDLSRLMQGGRLTAWRTIYSASVLTDPDPLYQVTLAPPTEREPR